MLRRLAGVLFFTAVAFLAYSKCLRPWHLHWGATEEELAGPMPLDADIDSPTSVSTRAITIEARPEQIWPWLVQMGDAPRAGYYSYAFVERLLGLDINNSKSILPQYQSLQVGDTIDKSGTMTVRAIEPGRSIVLGPPASVDWLRCTWAFAIMPVDAHSSRLVTRVRAKFSYAGVVRNTPPLTWPLYLLLDPGVFVMERMMLLGIKARAEALTKQESA